MKTLRPAAKGERYDQNLPPFATGRLVLLPAISDIGASLLLNFNINKDG